ncbi:hypothetical protein FACS189437_05240 [Bacteroidia bacterium]|nr:hypothetical protein FACS189437_05240 [Bacteroidia bacterium]
MVNIVETGHALSLQQQPELTSPVGTRFHLVPIIPTGSTCHTSGRTAKDRTNEVEPRPNIELTLIRANYKLIY